MKLIDKCMNKLERNMLIKSMTNNLGKVVEEEDKLFCMVDINKGEKTSTDYAFFCDNGLVLDKEEQERIDMMKLNKRVCYIFKNIHFKKYVHISSCDPENVDILLYGCSFDKGLTILNCGNVSINNCKMMESVNINASSLSLSDSYTLVDKEEYSETNLKGERNIVIKNSGIMNGDNTVNIESNGLINILGSKIVGSTLNIKGMKVFTNKSNIIRGKNNNIIELSKKRSKIK